MESKLYEECHEGGGFMAQQAMLKQDETVRTQIPTMKPGSARRKKTASIPRGPLRPKPVAEKVDFSQVKIEPLFEEMVDFDTFAKSDFRAVKIEACEAVPKSKKLLKFTLDDGTERRRTILSGIHEYYEPESWWGKPPSPL